MDRPLHRIRRWASTSALVYVLFASLGCSGERRADVGPHIVCPNTFYLAQLLTPRDREVPLDGALLVDVRRRDGSITGEAPAIYDPSLERVLPTNQTLALVSEADRIPLRVETIGGGFFRLVPTRAPRTVEYRLEGWAAEQDVRFRFGGTLGPSLPPVAARSIEFGERGDDVVRFRVGITFHTPLPPDTVAVALVARGEDDWVVLDRYGHEPPNWAGADSATGGPCLPPRYRRRPPREGQRARPVAIDAYGRVSPPGPRLALEANVEMPEYYPGR